MSPYKDPEKQKEAQRRWYHENKDLEKQAAYRRAKRAKDGNKNYEWHRQHFLDYLGGKCECCGTTENLEFDHIDPNSKHLNFTSLIPETPPGYPYTELVLEEADKCQLLCKSCHEKKTYTLDHDTILEKKARTRAKNQQ